MEDFMGGGFGGFGGGGGPTSKEFGSSQADARIEGDKRGLEINFTALIVGIAGLVVAILGLALILKRR